MIRLWTLGTMAAGFALALSTGAALAQQPGGNPPPAQPRVGQAPGTVPAQPPTRRLPPQAPAGRTGAAPAGAQAQVNLPGPIDSPQDLVESAKMLFKLADTNNDNQISQKEATDAGNLIVGGFFFRADQNGDGTLTREEAKQARDALFQQQPLLRFVLSRASEAEGGAQNRGDGDSAQGGELNPRRIVRQIGQLLDDNEDKQIQAKEVRKAVEAAVEALYSAADTNQDGQLTPAEINSAFYGAIREGVSLAFNAADQDNNKSLSKEEFQKAIVAPANVVFEILDRNQDGQLSADELERAAQVTLNQLERLNVPTPPNAPANVLAAPGAAGATNTSR
jgi:Ca2+-binding EF-hand superfamily protein